jgi:hypothetical protein
MSKPQELTGKVIKVLAPESGTGQKPWVKQMFVIETEGQYPKKVAFQAWNDKCDLIPNIGDQVTVSYNPESREYNEKWYTDLSVWKIEVSGRSQAKTAKKTEPVKTGLDLETNEDDDLPF